MLAKINRFHGHASQKFLYKNGTSVRSHLVTLKYISNPRRKKSRVSVVISKKVHKSAVGRNRIRRRIYEIMRHELPKFTGAYDFALIVIKGEAITVSHQELQDSILTLLSQAPIYSDK